MSKKLRVNQQIKAQTVRLIDDEENQLGIMGLDKALEIAKEKGMDLAEVAPNANPPVCRLMDFGKYLYHQKKVATKHRKMQKKMEVKGVRMGFKTDNNDIRVKARQAKKFLESGHTVKVSLIFRGRESMYKDLAVEKMLHFFDEVKDVSTIDSPPKRQGNTLIMILTPNK